MGSLWLEAAVILALVALNGVLAMAEIAVVSSRRSRLEQRAAAGGRGARTALALAQSPGPFLSTIQIGITLVGVVAGAYGGATLGEGLGQLLARLPLVGRWGPPAGFGLVVVAITVLSLVVGELVPKRIALAAPERIASALAVPVAALGRFFAPLERLLTAATEAIVKPLVSTAAEEPAVTEDEVRLLIRKGTAAGVFAESEQEMVEAVFSLADLPVGRLMTPRAEVTWLDEADPADVVRRKLSESPHSRLPVARGDLDDTVGFVRARVVLTQILTGEPLSLREAAQPPLVLLETLSALKALDQLREAREKVALVVDEFGAVQGLVSVTDLLEAVIGSTEPDGDEAVRREDGSWLLDGALPIGRVEELVGVPGALAPGPDEAYATLAGFVLHRAGRLPRAGHVLTWKGLRVEVVDLDGHRIDRLLVSTVPPPSAG